MKRFILQWHITEHCNCRCKHCYQDSYSQEDTTFDNIKLTVEQYIVLLEKFNKENNDKFIPGHINITGGEPLLHKNFEEILRYFKAHRNFFSYGLLTNGTLLNKDNVKMLKTNGVGFVQLSLEGSSRTHDLIRGKGNFEKVTEALNLLQKHEIPSLLSFTASRENYKEFSEVCKIGRKYRVMRVWSDRIVPFGKSNELKESILTPEETREYLEIMRKEQKRWLLFRSKTEIAMLRGLQFLSGGDFPYTCQAGRCLLTIMQNGDVLPCRRLPKIIGNMNSNSLIDIYYNHQPIKEFQKENNIPQKCNQCPHKEYCRGGNKCLVYALNGHIEEKDPGCFF